LFGSIGIEAEACSRPSQIFLAERKFQVNIVLWLEAGRTYFYPGAQR